jgi:hypothetical protein
MTGIDPMPRDLRQHLLDDLAEIDAAVEGYREGRTGAYQTIALQLRNLLTDTSRAGPLLIRVVPGATFHRLRPPDPRFAEPVAEGRVMVWEFDPRGMLSLGGGVPAIVTLDVTEELIGIAEWLNDWVIRRDITIRNLIHEVASKDAAHTDDAPGPTMVALESNQVLFRNGARDDMVRPVIVGLGEYVARRIHHLVVEH